MPKTRTLRSALVFVQLRALAAFTSAPPLMEQTPNDTPTLAPASKPIADTLHAILDQAAIAPTLQKIIVALATCANWLERPALLNHLKAFGASLADRQAVANALGAARREAETALAAHKTINKGSGDSSMGADVTLNVLNPLFGAESCCEALALLPELLPGTSVGGP